MNETKSLNIQELKVDKNKCPQNHKCPAMAVCPAGAISQKDIYSLPEVDRNKCTRCSKCVKLYPKGALFLVDR